MGTETALGGEPIKIKREAIPVDNIITNPDQPRAEKDRKDVEFLYRSIKENRGIAVPLLVEKIHGRPDKVRIVDGERRLNACRKLLDEDPDAKIYLGTLPCDVIQQELTKEQRQRLWTYIHRTRKEWHAMVKEKMVLELVDLVGRRKTADILGVKIREVDRIVDTLMLAERMEAVVGKTAISYARETKGLAKKYQTSDAVDLIVDKVNKRLIVDPVKIRKLKDVFSHPEAKQEFESPKGTIASALRKIPEEPEEVAPPPIEKTFIDFITEIRTQLADYPWSELAEFRGDATILDAIDSCMETLAQAKTMLEG